MLWEGFALNVGKRYRPVFHSLVVFLTGAAVLEASDSSVSERPAVSKTAAPFCAGLRDAGALYSNAENKWVQELRLLGRFQYQLARVDGTGSDGRGFNYDTDEFRRVWLGARARLLQYVEAEAQWIMIKDGKPKGNPRTSDGQIWEMFSTLDLGGPLAFNDENRLSAGYGRRILPMGAEWHTSSTKIKTVERSAIANKIWPDDGEASNPTGVWLEGGRGPWDLTAGAASTETSEGLADWTGGTLYYGNVTGALGDIPARIILDGFYQDAVAGYDTLAGGLEWVASAAVEYAPESWSILFNVVYGDNGEQSDPEREGDFWGLVILPSRYVWKDCLETVLRYEYQGAENPRGASLNSRYAGYAGKRGDATLAGGGRGDKHQSLYLGFNYYFCGDRLKLMSGIEYERMQSEGADEYEGWTCFAAFRSHL